MQLAELFHGLDHFTRKQSHQTGDHPGELAVAVAELLRPVQLVEKEPGRRPVARRGQQVGIAHFEAPGLVGLDRLHPLGQRGVAFACFAQLRHRVQVGPDAVGDQGGHGRRLTRWLASHQGPLVNGLAGPRATAHARLCR